MGWQLHKLDLMQIICTCSRQMTMPAPHHSVFTGRIPFPTPNQQRQSTEGKVLILSTGFFQQPTCHRLTDYKQRVIEAVCRHVVMCIKQRELDEHYVCWLTGLPWLMMHVVQWCCMLHVVALTAHCMFVSFSLSVCLSVCFSACRALAL